MPDICSNELWCRPGECAADREKRCVYPTDHGAALVTCPEKISVFVPIVNPAQSVYQW